MQKSNVCEKMKAEDSIMAKAEMLIEQDNSGQPRNPWRGEHEFVMVVSWRLSANVRKEKKKRKEN